MRNLLSYSTITICGNSSSAGHPFFKNKTRSGRNSLRDRVKTLSVVKFAYNGSHRLLRISVNHHGVVLCKERVLDSGETCSLSSL